MKILLLTPDIPYPSESGAAIRNWGIITGLTDAGHEVTLLTFRERDIDARSKPLYERCHAVQALPLPKRGKASRLLTLLASRRADMENRLASDAFASKLRQLLRDETFDIVQFSGLELGGYLDLILSERGGASLVYDALNAEAELQKIIATVDGRNLSRLPASLYSLAQTRRLQAFEGRVCREVDAVIAVSQEDREFLRRYAGAPISVMANGIHVDEYQPADDIQPDRRAIVFTGKMDYRPNVDAIEWFCAEVVPIVRRRMPKLQLTVVGRNPHQRLQTLAATGEIQLTGWVESVLPYLHEAAIYAAPLRMGSGTRLKILQAMAAGCAVVSTGIGAAGLNAETRSAMVIADEPPDFAGAILRLLADDDKRRDLGELARRQVAAHYDWKALMPSLLQVYASLRGG